MAGLVLGPMQRWSGPDAATVWVETDTACTVEVLGAATPTFEVAGHHYAIVVVDMRGRSPVTTYEVLLDGEVVWPPADHDWPQPVLRSPTPDRVRIAFGSCRAAAPDTEPWTLPRSEHDQGLGIDALEAYARLLVDRDHADWPDLLLLLGDQVYADMAAPRTSEYARRRRDTSEGPEEDVADFEEYTQLYREAWDDPEVRWLLSTLPTAMVFDDHDVIDDWNISADWLDDARATDWWHDRIVGALASYWLYQHLGNLSPEELAADELLAALRASDGDGAPLLFAMAEEADRDPTTVRWSFRRRLGDVDLVVVDSRAARVLDGERDMLDEAEWDWLADVLADAAPHVLVATSLPVLLPRAIHDVEVWDERLAGGAWGRQAGRLGEAVRRGLDLEHWAAFGDAFDRIIRLLHDVVARDDVRDVVLLAGDVHYGAIDRATWPDLDQPLWQVIASPLRQEVEVAVLRTLGVATSSIGRAVGRVLRASIGGRPPALSWEKVHGPVLTNHLAVLDVEPGGVHVRVLETRHSAGLTTAVERQLERRT